MIPKLVLLRKKTPELPHRVLTSAWSYPAPGTHQSAFSLFLTSQLWGNSERRATYREPREFSKPPASPEMFPWCPPDSCPQGLKLSHRQTHHWVKKTHFARPNWGSRSTFQGIHNRREAWCSPGPGSPAGGLVWQSPGEAAKVGQLQTLKDSTLPCHRGWAQLHTCPSHRAQVGERAPPEPSRAGSRGSVPAR